MFFSTLGFNKMMLATVFMIALLSGCGKIGMAVVLWPPESSQWETGDIVTVHDESLLRKTYIVNLPNQRKLKEEIDQWRLRLFQEMNQAASWVENLQEWKEIYAECLYQGLPMRTEPNNMGTQIYRFRKGDLIKILDREPGPVQVGNLDGYWYKVLAFGGVEGYVFDYHLKVMRVSEGEKEILNARDTEDLRLESFLTSLWRPQYFDDMIAMEHIDLKQFRPEYGLFIDREAKNIRLHLPSRSLIQVWSDIIPLGTNRYDFSGTSFRTTINSDTFVSIQYSIDGIEYFDAFVQLSQNVNDTISKEISRHKSILENLIENGPSYESQTYGKLEILKDGQYVWSAKSSLISQGLLSIDAGNTGTIVFELFLSKKLETPYQDVISFQFDTGETLPFLYSIEEKGLRLLYVPENAMDKGVIFTDQYLSPVHVFFVE